MQSPYAQARRLLRPHERAILQLLCNNQSVARYCAIFNQETVSARQICKMREIAKKADASLLDKIQNGSISINKSHEMITAQEAKKKTSMPIQLSPSEVAK